MHDGSVERPACPVVVLFLKAPREGTVKTRLAAALGREAALEVYRELAEHQLQRIPPGWRVEIHFTPADAVGEMDAWLGPHDFYPQSGVALGDRLLSAFDACFGRGAAGAIAIGADCPDLDATTLESAGEALRSHDVVLGPALDGGYYLIGLRKPAPSLFREIPWSTPEVLELTQRRASDEGLSVALLAVKRDIDDVDDWRAHLAARANKRTLAAHETR